MKTLYESILSKTGTGIEQSVRKWIASTNIPQNIDIKVVPVKGGYYVILDSFLYQPQFGTINIDKTTAHSIPGSIRGVFYQHYVRKGKPDYLSPIILAFRNTSYSKFEIPNLDFTQRDDINIPTFFDPITFNYSNADEFVGSIKVNSDTSYAVNLNQSNVHKKISLDMSGNSMLYINDGSVVNLHNIKGCKLHKLVIGDTAIAHTEAIDRDLTKEPKSVDFTHSGPHYYTSDYFTDLLKELESNNKIDVIEYIGDMIPSKRGQSVILSWREDKKSFIAK